MHTCYRFSIFLCTTGKHNNKKHEKMQAVQKYMIVELVLLLNTLCAIEYLLKLLHM